MSAQPEPAVTPRRGWVAVVILLIAQLMAVMDNSIVAVSTRTIRDDLGTSGAALQFILSGYTLAFAVLVVTGARLGDSFGQRRMFMTGLAGFTIASLLCGMSPTAEILIGSRCLQGAFGAMMVPQVLSSIQLLFTGERRAKAIGYYSLVLAMGVAAGQILGGMVVSADLFGLSWRMAFLINVPIGIVLLFVAAALLPANPKAVRQRLDLTGVLLLAATMAALVVPLVFGRDQGWPMWAWVLLGASVIGIPLFIWHERRLLAREGGWPLLDLRSIQPKGVRPGLLACCLLNFAFAGILFTLTLHLQTALEYTPLQAGLMFVPMPIGFAAVSLTWTKLPARNQKSVPFIGLLTMAAAVGGLAVAVQIGWPLPLAIAALMLAGAGMAAGFSALVAQVAAAVGPTYASAVSALVSTGTLLFAVISVAITGSIYLSWAETDVTQSATGFSWAMAMVSVLLLVGAACAVRTWQALKEAEQPAEQPEPVSDEPVAAADSGSR